MTNRYVVPAVIIATGIPLFAAVAAAQSTAGATVAQGNTRAMGRPFSGRLSTTTSRDAPRESQFGMLYAVLDGKGKLAINGTFERLASPATAAHFHRGTDGQRGPQVGALTTVTKATTGVIKGDIVLTEADIAELQKGSFYVEIVTENPADGVRGWLLSGMLKQ